MMPKYGDVFIWESPNLTIIIMYIGPAYEDDEMFQAITLYDSEPKGPFAPGFLSEYATRDLGHDWKLVQI